MAKARIQAGICGIETTVSADLTSCGTEIAIDVESPCPRVQQFAGHLGRIALSKVLAPLPENPVIDAAGRLQHPTCPVPCGVLKVAEVAIGAALPKDVSIVMELAT